MSGNAELLRKREARVGLALLASAMFLATLGMALACGSSGSTNSSSTGSGGSSSTGGGTSSANQYASAYKSVKWGSTMTVSFPSACEMTITTTGQPNYTPNAYYLAPANGPQPVVAYTAVTNTPLAVISYADNIQPSLKGSSATLNVCPTAAASTTPTNLGAIGYLISGTSMFNPFEMDATTPAVSDNASYTFTDNGGNEQTAYFIDQCDSHSNGSTWHAHGNASCVSSEVDTSSGPSHIIGIALDGFPIYGGRDINGNVISVSQLDACNGITSPTPEFPAGAYHYVLPIGVTTKYASINCYTGTVSQAAMAAAKKLVCNRKAMGLGNNGLPQTMIMPDGSTMRMR